MEEHWKDIQGYEGLYSDSDTGLVKTHIYNKILKPIIQLGYESVVLYRNKKSKAFKVHRLVATLRKLLKFIDSMQEEPVSEDLISVAKQYIDSHVFGNEEDKFTRSVLVDMFCSGAKWQKAHNWKPADGDDLPIIDREVIALLDNGKVVFAHRPPEYWDGKNIITGKVTRNYPKTYDKGGWNIPNVKYWLDCLLPNMED